MDEDYKTECAYCSVEIGPGDELYEEYGEDFCSDSCAEAWEEENTDEEE